MHPKLHIAAYTSLRELASIASVAFLLRLALFVAALAAYDMTLEQFGHLRDGPSYLRIAAEMSGNTGAATDWDRRVFPGYPALIALFDVTGSSAVIVALLLSWTCSGLAAAISVVVFRDARIGWAMAVLTPSYVMYSSLILTEAALLAFVMGGLLLAGRTNPLGAVLLGYAGLIRPVACFAVVGQMISFFKQDRSRKALLFGGTALAVVVLGLVMMFLWRGDALEGPRRYIEHDSAYAGDLLSWPFKSLITIPILHNIPLWKVIYIWGHVAVTLGGCALLAVEMYRDGRDKRSPDDHDLRSLAAFWLWGNTLFIVCLGSQWGFHEFDRFMIAALPPLFWAFRRWLPSHRLPWFFAAVLSFTMGLWGINR